MADPPQIEELAGYTVAQFDIVQLTFAQQAQKIGRLEERLNRLEMFIQQVQHQRSVRNGAPFGVEHGNPRTRPPEYPVHDIPDPIIEEPTDDVEDDHAEDDHVGSDLDDDDMTF